MFAVCPVWPDETLFLDPALHDFRTEVMAQHLPSLGEHTFWVPPVYILCLRLVLQVTAGWASSALVVAKSFSIATAIVVILLGRRALVGTPRYALLWVALLVVDVVLLRASVTARMDVLTLAFILAAALTAEHRDVTLRPIAAVLAALASLTHPVGLVALVYVALLLPRRVDRRGLAISAGAVITVFAVYYLVQIRGNERAFIEQLGLQLGRKGSRQLFQLRPLVIVFSAFGDWSLYFAFFLYSAFCLWREARPLFLLQALILLVILGSQEMWYSVYIVPLLWLGPVLHLRAAKGSERHVVLGGLALLFALGAFDNGQLLLAERRDSTRDSYASMRAEVRPLFRDRRVLVQGMPDLAADLLQDSIHWTEFSPLAASMTVDVEAARPDYFLVSANFCTWLEYAPGVASLRRYRKLEPTGELARQRFCLFERVPDGE